MSRGGALVLAAAAVWWGGSLSAQQERAGEVGLPVRVTLRAVEGLRYDVVRFEAPAGAAVELTLVNADQMLHNLIVARPGTRLEVVNAAVAMGPAGLERGFVPELPVVLAASRLLGPGESQVISFRAPAEAGVYPYVCTFPGHGFLMYGAMYVGVAMPAEGEDVNIPPAVGALMSEGERAAYPPRVPYVQRILMPGVSPAAIAVALPGGVSYCWDAGPCRLRYVWVGEFIDPYPHWRGAGSGFAEVKGEMVMRTGKPPVEMATEIGSAERTQRVFAHGATADANFPLRFGEGEEAPVAAFRGYRITGDGAPEFAYRVEGVDVHERVAARVTEGGVEVTQRFRIPGLDRAVRFVRSDDATEGAVRSTAGEFEGRVLRLSAEEGREFEIKYSLPRAAGGERQ